MGFIEYKEAIELNDLVILYINFNTIIPLNVTPTVLSKKGTCQVKTSRAGTNHKY
jgi:hypothetical protein